MKNEDLVAAANDLSTAADTLSIKTDTLVAKVEAAVIALKNADLTPEAEAAVTAMVAAKDKSVTAGKNVDTEVAKLDVILGTPAPAGS